jgi:hypothetical protein
VAEGKRGGQVWACPGGDWRTGKWTPFDDAPGRDLADEHYSVSRIWVAVPDPAIADLLTALDEARREVAKLQAEAQRILPCGHPWTWGDADDATDCALCRERAASDTARRERDELRATVNRCSTACAPLVGDDREGECQCATADGWKPLKQSTSEDAK